MAEPTIDQLQRLISGCMLTDRPALHRRLRRLVKAGAAARTKRLAQLQEDISASHGRLNQRRALLPRLAFPADLPITGKRGDIVQSIIDHQVVIVCGETGSGKTTQLPKMCLEAGRGVTGLIGHTQPRRIAARSVATRIAEELGSPLGDAVGYKVRFNDQLGAGAYIKLMTDGIVLAEIQHDRLLFRYDTIIIDEAHERSLNIDFLLGYLSQILPKRPDLKLIITSATIDPHSFASYFKAAPIIEVSGRGYPVDVRYRPLSPDTEGEQRDLQQGILDAVDELSRLGPGDILIFLPGERQIRELAEALRKHHPKGAEILPLYARLSFAEQNRVFQPHSGRRIVLATNVAETSLTVPGIKYIIDSGTARISHYSARSKVQRLPIEPISQAAAHQRAGRCGRTSPGVCIRLYSERDFENRPEYTPPEILRTNLASVILQMNHLRLGEVESFPFLDPPDARLINDGYKLLEELQAIDQGRRLTETGRKLSRLPVDPRLGRTVLAAVEGHCLREVLIIVSALAAQDPRERPLDRRETADQKQKRFQDPRSDFLSFIKLWEFLREQRKHLSKSKFRKLCREYFLSVTRVFEWQDIHGQLCNRVSGLGASVNNKAADYAAIHKALLTGLLSHIGFKDEKNGYQGTRNRRFWVFPGSGLHGKPPKWIMAAELVETSRLFARTVASIEPHWVVEAARHLSRSDHFEPHWQSRAAQVGAFEKVTLYGLVLVPRRRINYGPIAPVEAREIFIREALIGGRFKTRAGFFQHNHALVAEIMQQEAKARRHDILASDAILYGFYDARIPSQIYSGKAFEKWLKTSGEEPKLYLTRAQLICDGAILGTQQHYPDRMVTANTSLALNYHFEPGDERDGVTLTVPLALLNQLDPRHCEWLVPGLLKEKVVALIKGLSKPLRRNFVPAPDFARACIEAMLPYEGSLIERLSLELQRMTGIRVTAHDWRPDAVPDHLRMRFEIVDIQGDTLGTGRDLRQLQNKLAEQVLHSFSATLTADMERSAMTDWDFGGLTEPVEIEQAGIRAFAYRAVVDRGNSVDLCHYDTARKANQESRKGIRRLYLLKLQDQAKYLQKNLPHAQTLCMHFQPLGRCDSMKTEIVEAVFDRVFLHDGGPPTSRDEFLQRLEAGRSKLIPTANRLCELLSTILDQYHTLRLRLQDDALGLHKEVISDVKEQLGYLIHDDFILNTPPRWLEYIPRYLRAIGIRLDKLQRVPEKDCGLRAEILPFWGRYKKVRQDQQDKINNDDELTQYRWMLEEFRVSLFAQALKTSIPISAKRLQSQWRRVSGEEA
ncbi:MAG: ATP-dependent RNA helicase HrpA [Pseudomonadota bacterium]